MELTCLPAILPAAHEADEAHDTPHCRTGHQHSDEAAGRPPATVRRPPAALSAVLIGPEESQEFEELFQQTEGARGTRRRDTALGLCCWQA